MVDLSKFCGSDEWRWVSIGQPFSRHDFTYATDGKILIRVPRRGEVPENDKAPHAERVWPKEWPTDFSPIQAISLAPVEFVPCDMCDGRGTQHECPDCTCKCRECGGDGSLKVASAVTIYDRAINSRLAKLLAELPSASIAQPAGNIVCFRFDGGEGIASLLKSNHTLPIVGDLIGRHD